MRLYLTAAPDRLEQCLALTTHLAHAAFCVDGDGALHTQPLPLTLKGGIMVVQCPVPFPESCAEAPAREIMRLCLRRSFSGIVLDFPELYHPAYVLLAQRLDALARQYQRRLYIPEIYADAAPSGYVLICTALSGGSLQQRLEEAVDHHGAQRIALDLQRLAMDFPLPCPGGEGTPLTTAQLQQRQQGRSIFFSDELCARYFTCRQQGQTHFVLFDDADTLQRKMEIAGSLGIREGFVMLPEIEDIAAAVLEQKERS